jgi:hypothetical protein
VVELAQHAHGPGFHPHITSPTSHKKRKRKKNKEFMLFSVCRTAGCWIS